MIYAKQFMESFWKALIGVAKLIKNISKQGGILMKVHYSLITFNFLVVFFLLSACSDNDKYPVKLVGDKIMANYTLHPGKYIEEEVENIGRLVYRLAVENKEAKKLELTLQLNMADLEDKYGNKQEGIIEIPDKMNFDDLDDIRKYVNADKYLGNNEVYLTLGMTLKIYLQRVNAERFFQSLDNGIF